MRKLVFKIHDNPGCSPLVLARDFLGIWFFDNKINKISLVYMEIFINEFTQIIVTKTKNLEFVDYSELHEIFESGSYFVLGDRKNVSATYIEDDHEIHIFHNFDEIISRGMDGVELVLSKNEIEMTEFEIRKSHLL